MIVRRTSVFPAKREDVFRLLQRPETLQTVAAPYAYFVPADGQTDGEWQAGNESSYYFRLFGFIPFGIHTIHIERIDIDMIQSREHNRQVPVWDHKIMLRDLGGRTEYTDAVEIEAGWKTIFI